MPVIKQFAPRSDDIDQLQKFLAQVKPTDKALRTKLLRELKNIQLGDKGEKNAAYFLGEVYRDQDAVLINGLRLVVDDHVAQIDHLAINPFGVVSLYETKNFSEGLKVDEEGRFWYWSKTENTYIEMPSPIKQSERHESVLKKIFTEMGFVETTFRHFVVVDYQARLIKPKKGFENVCRPDRILEARQESNTGINFTSMFKVLGRLALGNTYSRDDLITKGNKLLAFNHPIKVNFAKKYGLLPQQLAEPISTYAASSLEKNRFYSQSELAKNLAMTQAELLEALLSLGWLEKRGSFNYLTDQGKLQGIVFRKAQKGYYYFLFPEHFAKKLTTN